MKSLSRALTFLLFIIFAGLTELNSLHEWCTQKKCSANEHKSKRKNCVQGLIKLSAVFRLFAKCNFKRWCHNEFRFYATLRGGLNDVSLLFWPSSRSVDVSRVCLNDSTSRAALHCCSSWKWDFDCFTSWLIARNFCSDFDYKTIMTRRELPNWWLYCFVKSSRILDCAIWASSGRFAAINGNWTLVKSHCIGCQRRISCVNVTFTAH